MKNSQIYRASTPVMKTAKHLHPYEVKAIKFIMAVSALLFAIIFIN